MPWSTPKPRPSAALTCCASPTGCPGRSRRTELIVTVGDTGGELALTAIKDTDGYGWTNDGGLSTCPDEYRTADGASLDQLV